MDGLQGPHSDSRSLRARITRRTWRTRSQRIRTLLVSAVALALAAGISYGYMFGPMHPYGETAQLLVEPGETVPEVAQELKANGLVRSRWVAQLVLNGAAGEKGIKPGSYEVSQKMDLWMLTRTLTSLPQSVFVTIPPSVRKEQIGELLAEELFWGPEQIAEWEAATASANGFVEGVYYPDTYLIPATQPPAEIAARLRARFTDVFTKYAQEAAAQGIAWEDVLTLASIVDRESSKADRALVAGILWNRLEIDMPLQVDATLQYLAGDTGTWWSAPDANFKKIDSPFNTYMYAGLPPHPINNPTEESVAAVLNPERTSCMFYLHDANHQIHCSLTYAGQKANVERYLR